MRYIGNTHNWSKLNQFERVMLIRFLLISDEKLWKIIKKGSKINRNLSKSQNLLLEEIKYVLYEILSKEAVSDIIKVLPMWSSSAHPL